MSYYIDKTLLFAYVYARHRGTFRDYLSKLHTTFSISSHSSVNIMQVRLHHTLKHKMQHKFNSILAVSALFGLVTFSTSLSIEERLAEKAVDCTPIDGWQVVVTFDNEQDVYVEDSYQLPVGTSFANPDEAEELFQVFADELGKAYPSILILQLN